MSPASSFCPLSWCCSQPLGATNGQPRSKQWAPLARPGGQFLPKSRALGRGPVCAPSDQLKWPANVFKVCEQLAFRTQNLSAAPESVAPKIALACRQLSVSSNKKEPPSQEPFHCAATDSTWSLWPAAKLGARARNGAPGGRRSICSSAALFPPGASPENIRRRP